MCGRFTRYHRWADIHGMYRLIRPDETGRNTEARYNIAPTEQVEFVTWGEDGTHRLREGRWWLVPWMEKEIPKNIMINARIETVDTTRAYRDAFRSSRCLIPADGFYEWTKAEDGGKDPWHIFMPDHAPFSFAGLWAHNKALDIVSCTIVTAPAEEPMRQLHDRQPVILDPDVYDAWLDPETPPADAKQVLGENLDYELQFYRVGRAVNASLTKDKQRNDDASMILPLPV